MAETSRTEQLYERIDRFPTQLVLTILWVVVGTPVCLVLRDSVLWVALMSVYAIAVGHWSAHLAWWREPIRWMRGRR